MARLLDKLLGRRSSIESLATGSDRDAFLRQLGMTDIFVIAAFQSDGLDPSAVTADELLAEIEAAAKDLSEREEGFLPFVYEREGRLRLPFFTADDHAQTFVGEYCKERNRVFPIQLLGVKGSVLVQLLPSCDDLVMNDGTCAEYVLPQADVVALRQIWG